MKNKLLLGFSIIVLITSYLTSNYFEIFMTLLLIELLIFMSVFEYYLNYKTKVILKSTSYVLIVIFALIVLKKVYEIISR
ncbi:conserved hypothetical protein [Methanocaldococcus infernus ME]|uniref:Uncharacterized protein n=1 Tax=Methanocaldococcus infernus (strain DSM 11812 / JCM 15783 / ME) TaxID=573063 RepID=D5VTJ7_METIM|nr:hypothetical protein [Methanocaldococcus infernus]ADG13900.1 conserved hypothetical protein [Methanocaldococcus infernus ME]